MGFLWEGSTGARAVKLLRELPQGTSIPTPEFARQLGVTGAALHQLLANAVQLRLIKKIRKRGAPCILWALGAGNDSATIERRRPAKPEPTPEELARRAAAATRRAARQALRASAPPPPRFTPTWPPGFVSTFDPAGPHYRPPPLRAADSLHTDDTAAPIAPWLRGLIGEPVPLAVVARADPGPVQLPLFDPREIGEPGHLRRRRLAAALRAADVFADGRAWLQTSFLEPLETT